MIDVKKLIPILLLIFIVACAPTTQTAEGPDLEAKSTAKPTELSSTNWMDITLTNINTNKQFTISQFNKPILLESFAVWCPKCTAQQKAIKELHEDVKDDVISISLNTDPNEDANLVKEHTQKNGFDWHYAISPKELTQSLIDEYGIGVVNAPSVPIILICPNKQTYFLKSGIKSAATLKQEIKNC